jgi:NifU-like protein involved in Fe-S cluster formation
MSETDLIKLYSQRILALAADIPHVGRLPRPTASVTRRAPLCGSTITVDIVTADGRITEYAQEIRACALGQASAAIFGAAVPGCTRDQVATLRDELTAMLREDGPTPQPPFDGYEVLRAARDYRNRHASILLAPEATLEAMDTALADA